MNADPTERAPVRVCHLITSLEVGGAQRMLLKVLERSDKARVESSVVSMISGGSLVAKLRAIGADVHELGMRAGRPSLRALRALRKRLRTARPHVLQTWLFHADLLGLLAGRSAGIDAIAWNLRGGLEPEVGAGLAGRAAPRLCALFSGQPDVVVTNSKTVQRTSGDYGYRPKRWVYLPNGFDVDRYRPDEDARIRLRDELGLDERARLVGCIARWHPTKNHAGLLEAFASIPASTNAHLVLVGAGTDVERDELAALPSEVRARVHPLGARSDVATLTAGFDLVVLTSTSEGFPNVLGEALACGVPALSTDVGESAEVIGAAGGVVPNGDMPAFAAELERLVGLDRARLRELGELGRARIVEHYEIGAIARAYDDLYVELAAG